MDEEEVDAWKHPSVRCQSLRVGRGRHPMEGQLSIGRMLEPEQQEEDILVGGVPGMRNRGLNKVSKLYT